MIKQTQTKLFDFADVGLDFCAGSKNKFPEVFKKMLVTGYNPQTASSISIADSQITLAFGVNHNYVADRILKVEATGGFNKEVYIDSVTTNSVVCTVLDGITTGLTGTISTRIASLGWEIVYEDGFIQIFKFKDLDESDLYIRLAHQNAPTHRNTIMPSIGRSVDLISGTITDSNAYGNGKSGNNSGLAVPKWEFTAGWSGSYNTYTYNQGLSVFGKGIVIGSPYHLMILSSTDTSSQIHTVTNGFVPAQTLNFNSLNLPVLFLYNTNASSNDLRGSNYGDLFTGYVGNIRVSFMQNNIAAGSPFNAPQAYSSFTSLDTFNTTTAEPIGIYEYSTKQFLGYVAGGVYLAKYASTNQPSLVRTSAPKTTYDIDLENSVYLHGIGGYSTSSTSLVVLALPVEEIKIGD